MWWPTSSLEFPTTNINREKLMNEQIEASNPMSFNQQSLQILKNKCIHVVSFTGKPRIILLASQEPNSIEFTIFHDQTDKISIRMKAGVQETYMAIPQLSIYQDYQAH